MSRGKRKTVKRDSVQYRIENRPVRFGLNIGRLVIDPLKSSTVQLNDGSYSKLSLDEFVIERSGVRNEDPYTRAYDPLVPADKEYIDRVNDLMFEFPDLCTGRVGLHSVVEGTLRKPFDSWHTAGAADIANIVDKGGYDVEECMAYELSLGDESRSDVIDALEDLYRARKAVELDGADDTPEL